MSPQGRREQIAFACERGLSKRRACGLLEVSRSSLSYRLRLPAKDAPVIEAMQQLSAQYPRFGYRRIRIFLLRQGHRLGWHRTHRLWRKAGLQLARRRPLTCLGFFEPIIPGGRLGWVKGDAAA